MPISVRDATLNELETRIRKFLFYDRILGSYMFVFVLSMLFAPLLGYSIAMLMGMAWPENWTGFLILVGSMCSLPPLLILQRKRREYNVESDEWAKFYVSLINTNLENYFKIDSLGWKKSYRKKALKNARDFLLCVEERFTVGQFKPVKEFVGDSISELKQNLRYRVIPAIEENDEQLLDNIRSIMYDFLDRSITIENLKELNKQIAKRLPNREPFKKGYLFRISTFMQTHKIVKHSVFLLGFVGVCIFLGYIGVTYFGIVREYVWTGSIALFVGLLVVYSSRQPREQK